MMRWELRDTHSTTYKYYYRKNRLFYSFSFILFFTQKGKLEMTMESFREIFQKEIY